MARPKANDIEASAIFKIENAFWSLLERKPFSDLTMQLLAKEAGINRNSLYYHYANLQEISFAAFQSVITDESSKQFIDLLLSAPDSVVRMWEPMQLSDKIRKLHLFASSESPLLRSHLKNALLSRWFDRLHIDSETLSPEEALQIDYIANGFIGVIGNVNVAKNPQLLSSFPGSPIGKAAIQTMQRFSKRGNRL